MTDENVSKNEGTETPLEDDVNVLTAKAFSSISRLSSEFLKESEQLFAAHWDARADLIKSIVSVASGALVLTVTFSNLLIGHEAVGQWRYILLGSWASFLLSIMFAMISFWFLGEVRAFPTVIVSESNRVMRTLNADNSEVVESIASILSEAVLTKMRFDKRSKETLGASLVAFMIALVLLGLFGFKRLAS